MDENIRERLVAFFEVEIRNEREGGVSPSTLDSALESLQQAPHEIKQEWFTLISYEDGKLVRNDMATDSDIAWCMFELGQLWTILPHNTPLQELIDEWEQK